jgi:hypothetical protein
MLLAIAGCSFDNPGDGPFRCAEAGLCPIGRSCVNGVCMPDDVDPADAAAVADGPTDDSEPAADAPPPDAMANADLCGSMAVDITEAARAGTMIYGDTSTYGNELGSPPSSGNCLGYITAGPDAFFKIEARAGDRIIAGIDAIWDTVIWLSDGCTTGAACLEAEDTTSASGEELVHTVAADGTIYLVIDSINSNAKGPYIVDLSID